MPAFLSLLNRKIALRPAIVGLLLSVCTPALAASHGEIPTNRLIVHFKTNTTAAANIASPAAMVTALNNRVGTSLARVRTLSDGSQVVQMQQAQSGAQLKATIQKLASDPAVQYAEPDRVMRVTQVPTDPDYAQQYDLINGIGGIDAPDAWDLTTGASGLTIAVLDTGILFNHPDIQGRTVAGYNFVSDPIIANNGVGRSSDASDPGDWVSQSDITNYPNEFYDCSAEPSDWHGTHVAGTIGAAANNGQGIAGINWTSNIMPVRVLGKCLGYESDIVDAMRWSVGMTITGVANTTTPARVLNMSLSGYGACDTTYQNAISDVLSHNGIIVAAAGNDSADVADNSPANCQGVIAVGAINRQGGLASYSNTGSLIALMAPGGDYNDGLISSSNDGATTPGNNVWLTMMGTSMATPHVSGVISLMLSVNPALTYNDVYYLLQHSASSFPTGTGSDCNTTICGAGILNAYQAVHMAQSYTAGTAPAPAYNPPANYQYQYPFHHYDGGGNDGGSGGGCAMRPDGQFDPLLPALLVLAGLWCVWRRSDRSR